MAGDLEEETAKCQQCSLSLWFDGDGFSPLISQTLSYVVSLFLKIYNTIWNIILSANYFSKKFI